MRPRIHSLFREHILCFFLLLILAIPSFLFDLNLLIKDGGKLRSLKMLVSRTKRRSTRQGTRGNSGCSYGSTSGGLAGLGTMGHRSRCKDGKTSGSAADRNIALMALSGLGIVSEKVGKVADPSTET
jgi:hypothetical protein